jgi:hypothetical protein
LELSPESIEEATPNSIDDFFDKNFISNDECLEKGCLSPLIRTNRNSNNNVSQKEKKKK